MKRRWTVLAGAALLLAILPGCDSADPTGPRTVVVTITVTPSSIEVTESATVMVSAVQDDGSPVPNAPAALSTSLGTLEDASLILDGTGTAETTLEAGDTGGTATVSATVTYLGVPSSGSATVEITEPPPPPGELDVQPRGLDLIHSRAADPCPNPFLPMLMLTNVGVADLDYRVIDDLPEWLQVDSFTGEVPGTIQVSFTCAVGDGDLDLEHLLQIQGVDRATQEDVGMPSTVPVTLAVRD